MQKNWKEYIYRSDIQVTFELYSFSGVYRSFIPNENNYIYQVLSYSVDFKAPWELYILVL